MESDDKSSALPFEEKSQNLQEMCAENQRQVDAADSIINNGVIQAIVDKFNIDIAKNHPVTDGIENNLKVMFEENNKLKDILRSNNESKNRLFSTVEKWLEDAQTIQKNYKRKLEDAQNTIDALKAENVELRKPIQEMIRAVEIKYQNENRVMLQENQLLREKYITMQKKMQEQSVNRQAVSTKDAEISRLFKKLEESERDRRKLIIERDRFISQEMKVQQILGAGDTRNLFPAVVVSGQKECQLKDELTELDKMLQSEEITFSQANAVPEPSSSSVSDDTEENSVEQLKGEISALRKQILNERAVCTLCRKLLSDVRSKFRVIYQLTLVLLKDHDSKIRALEISLVKAQNDIDVTSLRHELSDKQNRIIQLESDLTSMKEKVEEADKMTEQYFLLQAQMKVYEEDFVTVRSEKEALVKEKLQLEHNLHSLSKENKKLLKQLTKGEQSGSPRNEFVCFNETCQQAFSSEDELQNHVYSCFNIKD